MLNKNNQILTGKTNSLDTDKDKLLEKIKSLKATVKLQEQTIDCKSLTESEMQESEAERVHKEDLENEVRSLQKQVKQLEEHTDALKKFINEMRCENRQSETSLAQRVIQTNLAQRAKLTENIRKLGCEITGWQVRCSELEGVCCNLQKKVTELEKNCETYKIAEKKENGNDQIASLNKMIQQAKEEREVMRTYWTTAKTKYQHEKISHKKTKESLELEKQNLLNCQEQIQDLTKEFEKVAAERDDFEIKTENLTKERNVLQQEIASAQFECQDDDNDGFLLVGKKNKDLNSKSQNSKKVHSKSQSKLNISKSLQTITESNKSENHACCACCFRHYRYCP